MPRIVTVQDFYAQMCRKSLGGGMAADRLTLILKLYEVYCEVFTDPNRRDSLDEFVFWGDTILADFDDVDKYMVDPAQLFTNLHDFRDMTADYSFLEPQQKKALERLAGALLSDGGCDKEYNGEFLKIWDCLLEIYHRLWARLADDGLCYDGMVFRKVAEAAKRGEGSVMLDAAFPGCDKVIFVGLNALTTAEKYLMGSLDRAGRAEFCWDYPSGEKDCGEADRWLSDETGKASLFMRQNIRDFHQAFRTESSEGLPKIIKVECSSSSAQAKLLDKLLPEGDGDFSSTALVLADEGMLSLTLNSIPQRVSTLNVTMGYPFSSTQTSALLGFLGNLVKTYIYYPTSPRRLYWRPLHNILASDLFRDAFCDANEREICDRILSGKSPWIPEDELPQQVKEFLHFPEPGRGIEVVSEYCRYLVKVVDRLARDLAVNLDADSSRGTLSLELQALYELRKKLILMESYGLDISLTTFFSLLGGMMASVSIPFNGEPLCGLQIMGPLETRALDFEHLVILSAGEGIFPRKSVSSSFIPPEIRAAFALPTYEHQDAVWAYYFYRMIRRCSTLTLVYDSHADAMKTGEESRYLKQLEYIYRAPVEHYVASLRMETGIRDSEKMIRPALVGMRPDLSASSLQDYIKCPLMFYYKKIERLSEPKEVSEQVQANELGTIVHKVMEILYWRNLPDDGMGRREVSAAYIDSLIPGGKLSEEIKDLAKEVMKEVLCTSEIYGSMIISLNTVRDYVLSILKADLAALRARELKSFLMLGVEMSSEVELTSPNGSKFMFTGKIDRIDSWEQDEVRIVDYKTGKIQDKDSGKEGELIMGLQPYGKYGGKSPKERFIEKVFHDTKDSKWPKIAVQLIVYDHLFKNDPKFAAYRGCRLKNAIYATIRLSCEDPENSGIYEGPVNADVYAWGVEEIGNLLDSLSLSLDGRAPFVKGNEESCKNCPFTKICCL